MISWIISNWWREQGKLLTKYIYNLEKTNLFKFWINRPKSPIITEGIMLVKCRFLTYNTFWCNSQATLNTTKFNLPLPTKPTHPSWVPGSALSDNGYFHRISLSAPQGYWLGVILVYQRKITPILFWQKHDTERCPVSAQLDATFPCELRLHKVKYLGVANDMIRKRYPTTHKAVPGILNLV